MNDVELPPALLERIKARAADPGQRSDASAMAANSIDLGALMTGLPGISEGLPPQLKSAFATLSGLGIFGNIQVMAASAGGEGPARETAPLAPPCNEAKLAEAEAALGFALPAGLRQLYLEVADGGFGPGDGLFGLDRLVSKYRQLTGETQGPQGQSWPAGLIPIGGEDREPICLDRETGALSYWDAEELAEGHGDKHWRRSFKDEAKSLEAWFAAWLARPAGHNALGFPGAFKAG